MFKQNDIGIKIVKAISMMSTTTKIPPNGGARPGKTSYPLEVASATVQLQTTNISMGVLRIAQDRAT